MEKELFELVFNLEKIIIKYEGLEKVFREVLLGEKKS